MPEARSLGRRRSHGSGGALRASNGVRRTPTSRAVGRSPSSGVEVRAAIRRTGLDGPGLRAALPWTALESPSDKVRGRQNPLQGSSLQSPDLKSGTQPVRLRSRWKHGRSASRHQGRTDSERDSNGVRARRRARRASCARRLRGRRRRSETWSGSAWTPLGRPVRAAPTRRQEDWLRASVERGFTPSPLAR